MFRGGDAPCYDRTVQPQTAVVDTHMHVRPFGGPAIPFEEVVQYFEETASCSPHRWYRPDAPGDLLLHYYLDCPGTRVTPTMKNDFVNAADYVTQTRAGTHLTLAMTFPDLSQPASVLSGMHLLEHEYPGAFTWMGRGQPREAGAVRQWARPGPVSHHQRLGPFMGASVIKCW